MWPPESGVEVRTVRAIPSVRRLVINARTRTRLDGLLLKLGQGRAVPNVDRHC